jgi:hypothetical protein
MSNLRSIFDALITFTMAFSFSVMADMNRDELDKKKLSMQPLTKIESWNHVTSHPREFVRLTKESTQYNIIQTVNDVKNTKYIEINTTLVKKLIDSTRQHSNGIKLIITDRNVKVGELDKITFALKVDKEQLKLPEIGHVINDYGLEGEQITAAKKLFDKKAYLNITLFGESADNQSIKSIFATKIISLDSSVQSSTFLNVQINAGDFDYYWQQHWNRAYVNRQDVMNQKILGVLITAETSNGKTIRHYLTKEFPKVFEEKFIEMPITIKKAIVYSHNY